MHTIEQSIEIDAPVRTVYNQWTQFEEFPQFMEGVREVRQLDDKRLHWVAEIAGRHHEWDAEIFDQIPDQRVAWRSTSGKRNDGAVTFDKVSEERTRIHVAISYEPEGALEKLADALGLATARVKGDLKRFKDFVERRGRESGAWRGEIHGASVSREMADTARSKRLYSEKEGKGGTTASGTSGI